MVPVIVALYSFRFLMALWIRSSGMLLKVHLGSGYQKLLSDGRRLGLVVGKKVACRRLPLSLLLCTVLVVHFMMGSTICREGMHALATSVGGDNINLAACHMLELSRLSSQSIQ